MIFHDSGESVVIKKRFVIIINFWFMKHHSQVLNFKSIRYNHGSPSFFFFDYEMFHLSPSNCFVSN